MIEDLFERKGPIEVEIGVGKGLFLIQYAAAHPEINLLGIEKGEKWNRLAQERVKRAGIVHVKFVCEIAEEYLKENCREGSISAFHIYFPDPWPKRKHHKRRLINSPFLHFLLSRLVPGGKLFIATDHKEYFSVILKLCSTLSRSGLRLSLGTRGEYITNFQRKYEKEGREIYFLTGEKIEEEFALYQKRIEASFRSVSL